MSISCKVRMMVMWVSIPENKEFGLLSNLLGSGVLSAQHQWSGAPGKGTKSNVHACWCLCIMTRSAGGVLWDSLFHFLAQRRLAQNYTPTALCTFTHLTSQSWWKCKLWHPLKRQWQGPRPSSLPRTSRGVFSSLPTPTRSSSTMALINTLNSNLSSPNITAPLLIPLRDLVCYININKHLNIYHISHCVLSCSILTQITFTSTYSPMFN